MTATRSLWFALACAAFTLSLAVRAQAQSLNYVAAFDGTNGEEPSNVMQATDGNLYGVTAGGSLGPAEQGNVFRITPSGELTTVYNFCSRPHCLDGASPLTAPILGSDGNLYGVTSAGGSDLNNAGGWGTVYKLTLDGQLTTLYTFCTVSPCLDGQDPVGIIQAADGNFYGATFSAGQFNAGTLFKMTPAGEFSVVHNFCTLADCADGQWPGFAPIQGSDGNLYGTTGYGGKADAGILYDLTPSGSFNVVHTFLCYLTTCNRGGDPIAVVQDPAGNLFGTTEFGGINDDGTIFEITVNHQYLNLYTFSEPQPSALALANDGNFYGITGGINGEGAVYQFTPSGTFNTLYNFTSPGSVPRSALFQAPNGSLYGSVGLYDGQWNGAIYSLSNNLSPFVQPVPFMGKVGKQIIILGNGLTGSTSVTFNGVAAEFTVESDTYIKATVPAGATTGAVSVVTPSGVLNSNPQFVVTK